MAISRRPRRSRLTLALLILTSIAVLTLDFRDAGVVSGARDVAASVFSPLRGVGEAATRPFSSAWSGITGYSDLESENAELRERIAEYEGREALDESAAEQLGALLELNDIEWVGAIDSTVAKVVGGPISNFAHTVDIDKGTDDGVRVGMPVVTGAGLVGRVQQATGGRSTVRLITDPELRVGVRIGNGGAVGTGRGLGRDDRIAVDSNLDPDETVRRRTLVVTSGHDRAAYPEMIPVGRVVESEQPASALTLQLEVEPMVDVGKLSYVRVLLREDPTT